MVGCHYFLLAAEHRLLTGTKLYCLVTEARRCEQLAQGCHEDLSRVGFEPVDRKSNAVSLQSVAPPRDDDALSWVLFRYAYILYNDEETAKSVADEFTEDPPVYLKHALDVKLYREPRPLSKGTLSRLSAVQ